jgi:hypothetical protein
MTSPTRLSLATANPPDIYRDRRRGELGAVVGLNLKVVLSMVREPHHDKKMISKIKIHKSKIFKGFPNVPFNVVVFGGLDFFGLPQRKFLEWTRGNHL